MTSSVLEFPAMLHGQIGAIRRGIGAQAQAWGREYLQTGAMTQPRRMLHVPPGEVLIMHAGADFDVIPRPRWRPHLFLGIFTNLNDSVPGAERPRMRNAFESFCLNTPWGALYHAVSPPPVRSAERMARRLAALLGFWDVLQGPRYTFWLPEQTFTLEDLMKDIYGVTLEAWCPGGPTSAREHMALMVERMSRATREDCMEALLRVMPALIEVDTEFKHREVLSDPGFLREHLSELPPKDFESISSAYKYTVTLQLADWDRALARH